MINITFDRLKELAAENPELAVTIYLPLHKTGAETRQDSIYFAKLLGRAKTYALEKGFPEAEVNELLRQHLDLCNDLDFWNNLGANGGAFFISKNFSTFVQSPEIFTEEVTVGQRFSVKQLLRLLTGNSRYYILSLSKNNIRLIECDKYDCNELQIENMPKNIEDVLGVEMSTKTLQFHSSGSPRGAGRTEATFHGQGSAKDDEQDKNKRFINEVDKFLYKNFLHNKSEPLIIAAVKEYLPIYIEVSEYKNIVPKGIEGNYDTSSCNELHSKSQEIIRPYLDEDVNQNFTKYKAIRGTDNTSNQLNEILSLAYQGRIDKLFIHNDLVSWGAFDVNTGSALFHNEKSVLSEDLAELATFYTIINGGKVYILDPEKYELRNKIGALIRF